MVVGGGMGFVSSVGAGGRGVRAASAARCAGRVRVAVVMGDVKGKAVASNGREEGGISHDVGTVVEVLRNGKLQFGLVQEEVDGGMVVEVYDGTSDISAVKVTEGEIICLWQNEMKVGGDEMVRIMEGARNILENSHSRALNLGPLCKEMQVLGKKASCTSREVAEYLFPALMAGDKRREARAAAALLVGNDKIRFKRGPPRKGFYAVPQSVADSRARLEFVKIFKAQEKMDPEEREKYRWNRASLTMLRKLELAAASETAPNQATKTLLRELGFEETSGGAAEALINVGYWSAERKQAQNSSPGNNGEETQAESLEWIFPEAAINEANQILEQHRNLRRGYADGSIALWKDQRTIDHDIYCIDEFRTKFYDDAVSAESIDEKTIRLFVHIADVDAVVAQRGNIDRVAFTRGESMYLPRRPFHMIPPSAMEAASFSPVLHGFAVTVSMDVNMENGEISNADVFRSVLRPIIRVTYDQFNEIMDETKSGTYPDLWVKDLRVVGKVAEAMMAYRAEMETKPRKDDRRIAGVRLIGRKKQQAVVRKFERTFSHRSVDEVLTSAGECIRAFAKKKRCALPERRGAELFARRCGTAPMRRYVDLIIQRQIKSVLIQHQQPAGRRRMADLCTFLERRHTEIQKHLDEYRRSALYMSLAEQLADQKAAGVEKPLLDAKIIRLGKKKSIVSLLGTGLTAVAEPPASPDEASPLALSVGLRAQVRILDVKPENEEIRAEIVSITEVDEVV